MDDVTDNPASYEGMLVTVSGELDDVYGPTAFTIGGDGFFGEELLITVPPTVEVVGARSGSLPYVEDDLVQVTGTVRQYAIAEVESAFGFDFDSEVEIDVDETQPVVVAQTLYLSPRSPLGTGAVDEPVLDLVVVIDTDTLATDTLSGRTARFTDVEVREVVSDSTFWVGPDEAERLFVVLEEEPTPADPTEGRYDINAGQTITLTGTLQPVPSADSLRERWNFDDAMLSALRNEALYLRASQASGV